LRILLILQIGYYYFMSPFFKYIIQKNEKVYKKLTVIGIILITLNIKKERTDLVLSRL